MSFEVYTADYRNRHEINHAISVQMSRHYNDIGKLMLVVATDDYNIKAIEIGGLLYDTDTGATYTIQSVKYDTDRNYITVNGYTANWLLNNRAVIYETSIGNVESGVYSMISANMRGIPNISLATPKGLSKTSEASIHGGQLLDNVLDVLEAAEYGNRMIWDDDTRSFTFEIYEGRDLTQGIHAVVFSEEQGTASKLTISDDISIFRNVFYLLAKFNDEHTELLEVGDAQGGDRIEHWIKSAISQEIEESNDDYRRRAIWECKNEAGQMIRRQNFEVVIDPADIGTAFDIGDRIACSSIRFGMQFEARITGVTYKLDATGTTTSITLGEPNLTLIDEVRINGRY